MIQRGSVVTHKDDPDFRAEVVALTETGKKAYLYVTEWSYQYGGFRMDGRLDYAMLPVEELVEVKEAER